MYALLGAALAMALVGGTASTPELVVDIDFNDEVMIREQVISEAEVEKLIRELHANGAQTLLLRMGYLGYLPYRTKLGYPVGFDPDHARKHPFKRNLKPQELEDYITKRTKANARYAQAIKAFNSPEVFIRVGHELGMKVILWLDIFDDGYSGYRSKFIDEHSHCQWTARDGKTYFQGLISYAWPESRAFRVEQARELLDLGADGIHCSTSAHCRHLANVQQTDFYGYEQPVVQEYQKQYGVDIRRQDFDKEKWHSIKGDFMNRLYAELAQLCHTRGKELWIGLQLGDYTHLSADPYFSTNVVARYRNHWRQLVDRGIADVFIVGDYEICSSAGHAYWKAKGITPPAGGDLFAWAVGHYAEYCRGKTKLLLFSEWLPNSRRPLDQRLSQWAERVRKNGFDGIDVHEAANFELTPDGMELLRRFRDRLHGKPLAELAD